MIITIAAWLFVIGVILYAFVSVMDYWDYQTERRERFKRGKFY